DAAGKGLEPLSQYMHDAANAVRGQDTAAGKTALEQTAREFERLQRMLESERLRSQASEQISAVEDSIGGNPGEVSNTGSVAQYGNQIHRTAHCARDCASGN